MTAAERIVSAIGFGGGAILAAALFVVASFVWWRIAVVVLRLRGTFSAFLLQVMRHPQRRSEFDAERDARILEAEAARLRQEARHG